MAHVSRFLDPSLVERLNQLQVSARSVVEGNTVGQHRSPVKGASIEFRQHRFYAPGDEPRRLDWRVYARTDRPYIKEYDEETNLRCVLLLDQSGSMGYRSKSGSKFDYAARLAAAMSYLMLGQTESVGLAVFGEAMTHWLPPHAGTSQLSRIIDVLDRLSPQGKSDSGVAMREVAEHLDRRALVIVLSDLFAPAKSIRQGLARLRHDRHEVIAMRILDRNEIDFPFRRWARFRGFEGEDSLLTDAALARQTYQRNFRAHEKELDGSFHLLRGEFATFTTDKPLIETLTTFLSTSGCCLMFLKPIMLAGLGAAVIPLVLHLLSKSRYRNVEWGGMMFLQPSVVRARDSTRLRQNLLLALRMTIIGILAMALARPISGAGSGASSEETRVHAIIILDRSASMGISDATRTRLAAAKQTVINILSNLHRGDEVSLIPIGDPIDPGQAQPTTDLQAVAARVGAITPSYGRANLAAALEQTRQALSREANVTHELYLVCDKQAGSWDAVNDKFCTLWKETRAQSAASRFFVIPVGGEEADNVALESIRLPGPTVVRDMSSQVELKLHNFGEVPRSNLPVSILSNGNPIAQLNVNIGPNSSAIASTWIKFSKSGSQVLAARLTSNGLPLDDQIESAVSVLEPVRVLIITGESRSNGERTSADFVRLALAPYESAGSEGVDPASVRIIGVDDWWGISPDRDDVVILSNVGDLSDDQIRQLEQFAYSGGALIFAPGNLTNAESCNNDLYREGEGFLPASVTAPSADTKPAHLERVEPTHPIFEFLHDRTDALPTASVTRYLGIDDRSADARIIASLSNGKPYLLERPYGRGRVLMFTTTLGTEWNQLPMSSFYLPLMQSAVRQLAGANVPDRNLEPGEPIELSFDHQPAQTTATITLPNGRPRPVTISQSGQRWTLRFIETIQPGRYMLAMGGGANTLNYVVIAPRDESDPTPLTADRWAWLQRSLDFKRLEPDKDAIASAVVSERTGRELHLPLVGLVMLMALGEMALTRMWSRRM